MEKTYALRLLEELEIQIQDTALVAENTLQKAERCTHIAKSILGQLKAHVLDQGFAASHEEIHFFKRTKPLFLKQLIFYEELFRFEEKRPVGTRDELASYHRQAMAQIRHFFNRHEQLYNYYRLNRTDEDERYFLRGSEPTSDNPELDGRFSTSASYKFSKIMAMEAFLTYLSSELDQLERGQPPSAATVKQKLQLAWTDSKVAFIELIYALQSSGSVNHGKASVAQVMAALGNFLQIDPGNYYAVFQQNIRIRKKERAVYLNFLTESLEKRMDESDENPRYK